jgi:peptidoglycan/LPS O-acetylase OafA/YrhL
MISLDLTAFGYFPMQTLERQASPERAPAGQSTHFYVPFLDGLRAVSILLIMGCHNLGPVSSWIAGQLSGWVSVDLFFIISGFLITSILVREKTKRGNISLRNFYIRRWLRISPAYYAFLALMFVWTICRGGDQYQSSFAVAGLYLTNIDLSSGWGLCLPGSGLIHTWTLSAEEQFYLMWPGLLKFSGNKALKICITLIASSYIWRLYLLSTGASWERLYYGLEGSMESIMLGVASGLIWSTPHLQQKIRSLFSAPGTATVMFAVLLISCHFLGHPSTAANLPLFWAAKFPIVILLITGFMISMLVNPNSIPAKILSFKPLVWIGQLSYSLYLWHIVVNFPATHSILVSIFHNKYLVELGKFACCYGFALASFYLIEKPCLKLKDKYS